MVAQPGFLCGIDSVKGGDRMLTIIFAIALIWIAWKMLVFGLKAAWGIAKILATVVLLPLFIVGLVCVGLVYVAIPILIIAGIIALIGGIVSA